MADSLHFPGRQLNTFATSVDKERLVVGEAYFTVVFFDEDMTIPKMETIIYLGQSSIDQIAKKKKLLAIEGELYVFREIENHRCGIDKNDIAFEQAELAGVYEFEAAIDVLLRCALCRTTRSNTI
ncbi:MAG: hypothetical protein HOP09_10855 [Hyphomicrobium sp.]|nr:hypothetical protein [Hyphomicrobium sp.]